MKTLFLISILISNITFAAISGEKVEYTAGEAKMEGFLAQNPELSSTRPAVLIVHDWMGISKFTEDKATDLAKQGYVAFAVDIYGKDVHPKDQKEAGALAGKYKNDRAELRKRIRAAYDKVVAMSNVDKNKVVVMGYCFGGTTALELARSGTALAGTVSFHGGLGTPTPADAKNIKGKVLVLHGADDPHVPPKEVEEFKKEMKDAHVDMKFIAYPGAVHAFAVPGAGSDKSKGAAYDAVADKKSWAEFENFLKKL